MSELAQRTLVLGGVKSGKSRYAESLAQGISERVSVIATAQALDDEMRTRIKLHQQARPANWRTYEEPICLGEQLRKIPEGEVVMIDCLTLWVTNLLLLDDAQAMRLQVEDFLLAVEQSRLSLVMVSNETNMGVTPLGELSRRYCDEIGLLHQKLAALCDRVDMVGAGLPLNLKPGR